MIERKRLFFDIETGPIPVWVWDLNSKSNAHLSHKNIIKGVPWGIICICWKWAGEKAVHALTWDSRQSDRKMVKEFIPVLDRATEIVMHNGDRFDIPWIRGRAIHHRIPMRPNYPTLDTLKRSRRLFRFPSHRLDFLGKHLVNEEKVPVEFDLWKSIVEDKCPAGMAKMVRYCKQDVRLLEKVFDQMAPYVEPVTSVAHYPADCPECGRRDRVVVKGYRRRASGYVYVQLACTHPHGSSQGWKWFGMPASRYQANRPLPEIGD